MAYKDLQKVTQIYQQSALEYKQGVENAVNKIFTRDISKISATPLTQKQINDASKIIADTLTEKTPQSGHDIYNQLESTRIGTTGFQWSAFRSLQKVLEEQNIIPQNLTGDQYGELLTIKDNILREKITFTTLTLDQNGVEQITLEQANVKEAAQSISEQSESIQYALTNKLNEELSLNLNLSKEEAGQVAEEISNKVWVQLYDPDLSNQTNIASLQREMESVITEAADDVLQAHGLSTTQLPTISASVALATTPILEPVIKSPVFEVSKQQITDIWTTTVSDLSAQGIPHVDSVRLATKISKEIASSASDRVHLAGPERIIEVNKSTKKILRDNLTGYGLSATQVQNLTQQIGTKIEPQTTKLLDAPATNELADVRAITGKAAFGWLFAPFEEDKGQKYFEQTLTKSPLDFFAVAVLGEPSIEEWIKGKGEKRIYKWIGGPFSLEAKMAILKGTSSKELLSFVNKATGNSWKAKAFRVIHNIGDIKSGEFSVRQLTALATTMEAFENTTRGRMLLWLNKATGRTQNPFEAWNPFGLGIIKIPYSKMLFLATADPRKIPELVADQIKKHVLQLTVYRAVNYAALNVHRVFFIKTPLYKVVNIRGGTKIIQFQGPIIVKNAVKKLTDKFFKTTLGKKAKSWFSRGVGKALITAVKFIPKLLASIAGIIGLVWAIWDILTTFWPLIKKLLRNIGLAILAIYLLFAQLGIWALAGAMLGGIFGAIIGQLLIPIPVVGAFIGFTAGTVMGGFVGAYLIPSIASFISSVGSALASALATLTSAIVTISTIFGAINLAAFTVVATMFSIAGIAIITIEDEPIQDYAAVTATATPPSFQSTSGTSKIQIEIKPVETFFTKIGLKDISIEETLSVLAGDKTKQITLQKNNPDSSGCTGINETLTSVPQIKSGEKCSFSYEINVQKIIEDFRQGNNNSEQNYTIAIAVSVAANVYDKDFISLKTNKYTANRSTATALIQIGQGGGGDIEPNEPLPNVAELPSGWPTEHGTITQGYDTCRAFGVSVVCNLSRVDASHGRWPSGFDDTEALDMGGPNVGKEVFATHTGVITYYKSNAGGNTARIDGIYNGKPIRTEYIHISDAKKATNGTVVKKGSPIGIVSITRQGVKWTGPHLHYRIDPISGGIKIRQIVPSLPPRISGCVNPGPCNFSY